MKFSLKSGEWSRKTRNAEQGADRILDFGLRIWEKQRAEGKEIWDFRFWICVLRPQWNNL